MVEVRVRKGEVGDIGGRHADIGKLAGERVELDLPVAAVHVLPQRPPDQPVGQAGVEEQDALGVDHEEAGHRHVGIGHFFARQAVVLRAVVDQRAAIDHVEPGSRNLRQRGDSRGTRRGLAGSFGGVCRPLHCADQR